MNAVKSDKDKSGTQVAAPVAKVTELNKAQPKVEKPETKESKPASSVMSQREAVYAEVARVLREDKIALDGAAVKQHMTEDRLKRVYDGLMQGFRAKKVALKDNESNQRKLAEDGLLKTYCIGLVNNWLRRDGRLNGKGQSKKS